MSHDEVITELWRVKDEIAAECNYDIHALIASLREDEQKLPRDLLVAGSIMPNRLSASDVPISARENP